MRRAKCIIICAILLSLVIFDYSPETHADMGPKGDQWVIFPAVGCAALVTGGILLRKHQKHERGEPITGVLFDEEEVMLDIEGGAMTVDASFEYQNITDKRLVMDLFFPFTDDVEDTVKDISLLLQRSASPEGNPVAYTVDGRRIECAAVIEPREKMTLKIHYRELLEEKRAQYILTSFKRWQRPVGKARVIVRMPETAESPKFSFSENLVERTPVKTSREVVYRFEMRNLYPDKEFQIGWQ